MKKEKRTHLEAAEYWEWRTTITELELQKQKLKFTELEYKLLQKEIETMQIRQGLFVVTKVQAAKDAVALARAEYDRIKKSLEEKLGISLNDKIIDDVTFEIKQIQQE